jgi:hypothetical protein
MIGTFYAGLIIGLAGGIGLCALALAGVMVWAGWKDGGYIDDEMPRYLRHD